MQNISTDDARLTIEVLKTALVIMRQKLLNYTEAVAFIYKDDNE